MKREGEKCEIAEEIKFDGKPLLVSVYVEEKSDETVWKKKSENLLKFPVSSSFLVLAAEKLKGLGRYSGNWKKTSPFHLSFFSQAIYFSFTF